MKRVEAPTLEEAYEKAATQLACSITDLEYEVVQYPSKGILGFLKKKAIIVATCKKRTKEEVKEKNDLPPSISEEESIATEIISAVKDELEKTEKEEIISSEPDAVLDSFFEPHHAESEEALVEESIIYDELALLIEEQLKELLSHSCFDIDIVEVDVRDNTALIFIDGEDAALLIGKEGYRYNTLSYMLFNWLHTKYELFIKLEIAEFLTSQQEMIRNYIKPVIENVEKHGRGKTRTLDGILVQIALEQLREAFPDKYVAVKTGREGKKFVVINEFNNKSHA
ncbi:MAG: hypothetical protein P794_04000 [Epsilonproteobacteria bacterium (ex Lamellibrachia satsuma)]|nr:MAG: hypothetical protein P794_04000 [Epsilonproteobacteria bacterium (ex Lamellibrachia satsuma)]